MDWDVLWSAKQGIFTLRGKNVKCDQENYVTENFISCLLLFSPNKFGGLESKSLRWARQASRKGRDYSCVRNVSRQTSEECYMGYVMGVRIWIGSIRLSTQTNDGQLWTRYCISEIEKNLGFLWESEQLCFMEFNYMLQTWITLMHASIRRLGGLLQQQFMSWSSSRSRGVFTYYIRRKYRLLRSMISFERNYTVPWHSRMHRPG